MDTSGPESQASTFNIHFTGILNQQENSRVDHANFRYLLWKAMAEFPEVVEQRSRDIVPLFFRFLRCAFFLGLIVQPL